MPTLTPHAVAEAAARREREAAALRENLRRRKAQVRLRQTDAEPNPEASPVSTTDQPKTDI